MTIASNEPRILSLRKIYFPLRFLSIKIKFLAKYHTFDFFNDINIEINTSCNKRCQYCPNSIYDRGLIENEKLMDEKLFKKIIDDLSDINFDGRISPHFYGEPTIDKRLVNFVSYIKSRLPKAKIAIVTNGDFLTVDKYNQLIDAGANFFFIMQHAKEIGDNHKKILQYFKENRDYKIFETIKYNFPSYEIIYKKKKHDKKVIVRYQTSGDNANMFNRGGLVSPPIVIYTPRCKFIDNPLVIDYNGNVVLCCNDYFSSVKFGNLKDKNIVEVWNSEEYKKIRKELRKGKYKLDICKKCVGLIKSNN